MKNISFIILVLLLISCKGQETINEPIGFPGSEDSVKYYSLSGYAYEYRNDSKHFVENISISIDDSLFVKTDSIGFYKFDSLRNKEYSVHLFHENYNPFDTLINLSQDSIIDFRIRPIIYEEIKFYPLQINNIWVYEVDYKFYSMSYNPRGIEGFTYFEKYKIIETQSNSDILFYKIFEERIYPDTLNKGFAASNSQLMGFPWQGIGENVDLFYSYNDLSIIYSYINFLMVLNEVRNVEDQYTSGDARVSVVDVGSEDVFSQDRSFKVFLTTAMFHRNTNKYVEGIGLYSGSFWEESNYNGGEFRLKGCVIDNVVYGDTSTVFN